MTKLQWGIASVFIVLALIVAIIALFPEEETPTDVDRMAEASLLISCAHIYADDVAGTKIGDKRDSSTCAAWANTTLHERLSDVRACQRPYDEDMGKMVEVPSVILERFEACIIARGIEYPPLE